MAVRVEELAIDAAQLAIENVARIQGAEIGDRTAVVVVVINFATGSRKLSMNAFNGNQESIRDEACHMVRDTVGSTK